MSARSGNQGLQIALIIFVMLTIVLSLTTFVFFKQAEESAVKSKSDAAAAQVAQKQVTDTNQELKDLRRLMGLPEDLTTNTITKVTEQANLDFTTYGSAYSEVQQAYSPLIKAMHDSAIAADKERARLQDSLTGLEKDLADERAAHLAAVTVERERADKAEGEKNAAIAEFTKVNNERKQEIDKLTGERKAIQEQMAAAEAEHGKQMKTIQVEIAQLRGLNQDQGEKIKKITRVTFETSDGEIRWVNQRQGIVWINLGRADHLPKQLPFSVWGRDENDVARAQHKAKIEVTQILGEHLAEARIVEDNIADPILPGDKIFTPLWQVGRQEHFAVIGFIDFNDDGLSDFRMFEELIKRNGAVIDAAVGDDGKITRDGAPIKVEEAMSIETRYLVVGDEPKQRESDDNYSKMLKQAETLGVEVITISKFLDHMGWKDPSQVIELGLDADPDDFNKVGRVGERKPGVASGATSGQFKPRRPRDQGSSAFETDGATESESP